MGIANTSIDQITGPSAREVADAMGDVCNLVIGPAGAYDQAVKDGQPMTVEQKLATCEQALADIDTRVRTLMGWLP